MKTTPARLLLALALGWSSLSAFAQAVTAPDSSFQRFLAQTTGVGKQTISFGSGGQVISSQGVPTLSTAGGPVEVSRTIPIRNPSGVPIPASAKVAVPPAVLGRALRGLAVSLPVIGTGIALYQVAQELGFLIEKPAGGELTIGSPFISGTWKVPNGTTIATGVATPNSGWTTYINGMYGPGKNPQCGAVFWNEFSSKYQAGCTSQFMNMTVTMFDAVTGNTPLSLQQLEDAIASKSGWPSGSAVTQAFRDALDYTNEAFNAPVTVSGPATSLGPTTTTVNGPETTQTTTTHTHEYAGDVVTTTTVTNTTVFNTTTGDTISTSSTTTQPTSPSAEPSPFEAPCGIAGKPACDVKIDETGVPDADSAGNRFDPPGTDLTAAEESVSGPGGFISQWEAWTPGGFTFSFNLPTGCTPLPVFEGLVIDVCDYQSQFHGLMSLVWILTGVTGLFVIFNKAQ